MSCQRPAIAASAAQRRWIGRKAAPCSTGGGARKRCFGRVGIRSGKSTTRTMPVFDDFDGSRLCDGARISAVPPQYLGQKSPQAPTLTHFNPVPIYLLARSRNFLQNNHEFLGKVD